MRPSRTQTAAMELGLAAGIRSLMPLPMLSAAARAGAIPVEDTPFAPLADEQVQRFIAFCALGEVVADKLPFVPRRTRPVFLLWRGGMGALAGAVIATSEGRPPGELAAIGGVAAIVGAQVAYRVRMFLQRRLGVPNILAGLIGDVAAALIAFDGAFTRERPSG